MRCLFLYHEGSGRGKAGKKLPYIKRRLKSVYSQVDAVKTTSAEELTTRVKAGLSAYDAVIFSGGDGTFNDVLQAAEGSETPLGYLPTGTVNDVARSLGIPRSVKGALGVILEGRAEKLDCMRVGERRAMYIVAAGALTSVTYTTPQPLKRAMGAAAYAVEAILHELDFRVFPLKIVCDGKEIQTSAVLVFVLNGRSVAGWPINRNASMKDGKLEVVVIRQATKPNAFQKLTKYFSLASLFLFGCRVKKKDIAVMSGNRILIETEQDVTWDFDGEEGVKGNIEVTAERGNVKLFVPRGKKV